jgi:hypothetical protein
VPPTCRGHEDILSEHGGDRGLEIYRFVICWHLVSMSVTLVSNAYLDETSAKIRSKPVPWEVTKPL